MPRRSTARSSTPPTLERADISPTAKGRPSWVGPSVVSPPDECEAHHNAEMPSFQFVRNDSAGEAWSHAIEILAEFREDPAKVLYCCEINCDLAFSRAECDLHTRVQPIPESGRQILEKVLSLAG